MSLEKALEANTAAVLALAESNSELKHQIFHLTVELSRFADCTAAPPPSFTVVVPDAGSQPVPKKQEEKASAPSKAATAPAAATPASTEAKQDAATSTSLNYDDDIKKPFLALAKRDLDVCNTILAELGVKSLSVFKDTPEKWPEIKAKLDAIAASEEGMA